MVHPPPRALPSKAHHNLLKSAIKEFIRDESSPRALRRHTTDVGAVRAPTERDLRAEKRRTLRLELAPVAQTTTTPTILQQERNLSSSTPHVSLSSTGSKNTATPANYPSPNLHSQPPSRAAGPSPPGEGVNAGPPGPTTHTSRTSNSSDFQQDNKPKINFPPSSDPVWTAINHELDSALPLMFTDNVMHSLSTSDLSAKIDNWLHAFFVIKFGLAPVRAPTNTKRASFRHRGLERLRRQKRELRAAKRTLQKAGKTDTEPYRVLCARWLRLIREHNRLRIAVHVRNDMRARANAEKHFKKDPNAAAAKLFKSNNNGAPTFSKEEATAYFEKTYHDPGRGHVYEPLPDLPRPAMPESFWKLRPPTQKEIRKAVRPKANKAAPGLNSLTYVPYKKCPAIQLLLHRFFQKVWNSKDVPEDWAAAFIVLLSKDPDKLHVPSEFRPIAITNTVGKIFFSVISSRLQTFLVKNKYILKTTQKGFLAGVAGCVEHSFTLFEALREAKDEARQIVVAWIDLANAYGSVRHNLIQFALNWYHVPAEVQALVFDYYNKLMAKVVTKEWSTGFFLFDIGLFQGCVLSTILFDCVFQLLLDFLKPHESAGYKFKHAEVQRMSRAYADDLAFSAQTPAALQTAVHTTDKFLEWTVTMKAKPRKCIAVGFRQFDHRTDSGQYTKHHSTKWSAFDPIVYIADKKMRFIVDPTMPSDELLYDHFKFLGRWASVDLTDHKVRTHIMNKFVEDVKLVQRSKFNGLMKLWIYQHYLLARLSWPFLINDLARSFAAKMDEYIKVRLKRWAGLYRGADLGCLFRPRSTSGGLGLSSIKMHFEKMQVIKCSLLESSDDPDVTKLYRSRAARTAKWKVKWSASTATAKYAADALLQARFPAATSRRGLGHGDFNAVPSKSESRQLRVGQIASQDAEARLAHSTSLCRQGSWTTWHERTVPFDLSWQNLIYGPGPYVIKFVLNATIKSCRTPDMLALWGYKKKADCVLCDRPLCTLHHILSNCKTALNQGRYTWRHDSVLAYLEPLLAAHIKAHNGSHRPRAKNAPAVGLKFVQAGAVGSKPRKSTRPQTSLLEGANDWRLLVDVKQRLVFPPEIYSTAQRPDIVIWSPSLRKVYPVELTVPAEEGIEAAQNRKLGRYTPLVTTINEGKRWNAKLMTIEVGARGFVARTMFSFLRKVGLNSTRSRKACRDLSTSVAKCSYAILLSRESPHWDRNRELINPYEEEPPPPAPRVRGKFLNNHDPDCESAYGRPCSCGTECAPSSPAPSAPQAPPDPASV